MKKKINLILVSIIFAIIIWISISLSNQYYTTIEVPLQLINFPPGFSFGTKVPDNVVIKLKAKGWKLIGINFSKELEYLVSVGKDTGKTSINLINSVSENSWISSDVEIIEIFPNAINIFVDKVAQKKLPVEVNFDLTFKEGFGLAEPIVTTPDSVYVLGSLSLLKNYQSVKTVSKSFSDLDEKFVEIVSLKKINGLNLKTSQVEVFFNVQKIVDKEFTELPVEIFDLPPDRDVLFIPNKINVTVRGGIEILGKLNKEDFKIFCNYKDALEDTTGSLIPSIILPKNSQIVFSDPEKIKFIIKKF